MSNPTPPSIAPKLPDVATWQELAEEMKLQAEKFKSAKGHMHPLMFVEAKLNYLSWVMSKIIEFQISGTGRIIS